MSPEQFAAVVARDARKWSEVITARKISED
jgi:hypothetical protein